MKFCYIFNPVCSLYVTCMVLLSSWCHANQSSMLWIHFDFFSWDFLGLYLQNWHCLGEFLPTSHPCEAAQFKSSCPSLFCSFWGVSQLCRSLFAPAEQPERLETGAACLFRLINLCFKIQGNKERKCMAWSCVLGHILCEISLQKLLCSF